MQPSGVPHGERPKRKVVYLTLVPMERNVNHKCTSHVHYGLDSSFSSPILMFSSHSRVRASLMFLVTVSLELGCSKNSVIPVIMKDLGASQLVEPFFETKFRIKGVACSERYLIFDVDCTRCRVMKNCTAMESVAIRFATVDICLRPGFPLFHRGLAASLLPDYAVAHGKARMPHILE
jgi:hypothetical protein